MRGVIAAALAIPFLVGLGSAQMQYQTAIPLPSYGRTYYKQTCGFTFEIPVDLTVVGLRVPDERSRGRQHVCLYRSSVPTRPWPSTPSSLSPVFSRFNEPSANIIPCSVPYKAGEWFIAMGACATTIGGETCNSLATPQGPYWTSLFGRRTTILRTLMFSDISTLMPPHPIFRDDKYEIGRVEVYVTATVVQGPVTVVPGGTASLALRSDGGGGLPYQVASSFGSGPVPIGSRRLELSLDGLLVLSTSGLAPGTFQGYRGALDSAGKATARLTIPNLPALRGMHIYSAFMTFHPRSPLGIQRISNAFRVTVI